MTNVPAAAEMMNNPSDWPEPVVRVQSLSGLTAIPEQYVKPPELRPSIVESTANEHEIPLIDFGGIHDADRREATLRQIADGCHRGFFQLVNHGIRPELMDRVREVWLEFFHQDMKVKQAYASSPVTYEGYGSRLGTEKGAILDWNDFYYLHFLPSNLRDFNKWPAIPSSLREVMAEYSEQVVRLGGELMKILSVNLGLEEDRLQNAFGGEEVGACVRVNFYPKCPQPELTYGLSPHSDPGGLTILLPDPCVPGLQVRRSGSNVGGDDWAMVNPAPHGIIVNMGDQIELVTNAIYKSIEHRVIVNSSQERMTLAYFYNPKSDMLIEPIKELVTPKNHALYPAMTFDEYRVYIRSRGLQGKSQLGDLENSPK